MQLIYFIVRFQRIVIYFSFTYQQGIGMPLLPPANEVWGKVILLHNNGILTVKKLFRYYCHKDMISKF